MNFVASKAMLGLDHDFFHTDGISHLVKEFLSCVQDPVGRNDDSLATIAWRVLNDIARFSQHIKIAAVLGDNGMPLFFRVLECLAEVPEFDSVPIC